MILEVGLIALFAAQHCAAVCFFRNGDAAYINGQLYRPCPNSSSCCLSTDTCVSNGLCRDSNNHEDGSEVFYEGSYHNSTGLYQTPACVNVDFSGCSEQCTNSTSSSREYIWACDSQRTSYCCESGPIDQSPVGSCCSDGESFVLPSPSVIAWSSMSTSTSSRYYLIPPPTPSTTTRLYPEVTYRPSSSTSQSDGPSSGVVVGLAIGLPLGLLCLLILLCSTSRTSSTNQYPSIHANRLQMARVVPPPRYPSEPYGEAEMPDDDASYERAHDYTDPREMPPAYHP